METVKIDVVGREATGKGAARRLRREGSLPAVVYGRGKPTVAISLPMAGLKTAFSGGSVILELEGKVSGMPRYAMIKQLQVHPVRHSWIHVDLEAVDLTEEIETAVPVTLVGIPTGVSVDNGMLDDLHHAVTLRGLPAGMPTQLEVDVSALSIGDTARVADLSVPDGVTIVDEPETVLASVLPPTLASLEAELGEQPEETETGTPAGEAEAAEQNE